MMKKFAATLLLLIWTPFVFAQDLNYGEDGFVAEFEIDAAASISNSATNPSSP